MTIEKAKHRRGFLRGKMRPPKGVREKVLNAARGEVMEQGFETLSFNAVARRADVPRAQVANLFESPNDLALTILEELHWRWIKRYKSAVKQAYNTPIKTDADVIVAADLLVDTLVNDGELCLFLYLADRIFSRQISAKRAMRFKVFLIKLLWQLMPMVKKQIPILTRRDVAMLLYPIFSQISGTYSVNLFSIEVMAASRLPRFKLVHYEYDEALRHGIRLLILGVYHQAKAKQTG